MALTFTENTQFVLSEAVATIMQQVLLSSDWSHLQITGGTSATTLDSAANAGATSVSTVASVPSGSYIVIGKGSPNPEVRRTTGVSGAGPYTLTFTAPLGATYSGGANVGTSFASATGAFIKCTTTRGAQMVIDLAYTAATGTGLTMAVYASHDGTTGTGLLQRWFYFGGTASHVWRLRVSAGKEHLYVEATSPLFGETGYGPSFGSLRNFFAMCDVVPYHAGDTQPVVAIMAEYAGGAPQSGYYVRISKNAANTINWVPASLATLEVSKTSVTENDAAYEENLQHLCKADGKTYLFPYVVFELQDGLRGRLSSFHNGGPTYNHYSNLEGFTPPNALTEGTEVSYGGVTYRLMRPILAGDVASVGLHGFGGRYAYRTSDHSQLIAVPVA